MITDQSLISIEEQVKEILGLVLKVDRSTIDLNTNRQQFVQWDSLAQLRLISALEEKFTVEFSDEQVMGLSSYREIVTAITSLSTGV